MSMHPTERPACRGCLHQAQDVCRRSSAAITVERKHSPAAAVLTRTCGVNGRYFVPAREQL